MKWKILFGFLFVASVAMMFIYINKALVVYSRTITENVPLTGGGYSTEPVTKTFQDNYASNGAVISFGIIAGAAVIGFALITREEQNNKS